MMSTWKNKNIRFFNCGKIGHGQRNCRLKRACQSKNDNYGKSDSNTENTKNFSCYNCGGRGHIAKYCKKPKANLSKVKPETSQGNKADKDKNTKREVCMSFTSVSNLITDAKEISKDVMSFYLDSGATEHYVNNDRMFESFINLKEPIKIKIYKKNVNVDVIKIGTIQYYLMFIFRKISLEI